MKETIFDLIDDKIPEGKKGYMDIAGKAPQPKEKSFFGDVSDYAKTFLKGSVEGLSKAGQMMSGSMPGSNAMKEREQQTENLNEYLPTDEGFVQKGMRRGLNEAPSMMAFPGNPIQAGVRTIGAGYAGQGAEELGAPEWLQTAAELTAYIGPDITQKLLEKGSNAELIKSAKDLGLSDEAITPLLQSEFKQKWLSKLSPKRGSTQQILGNTEKELGNTYNTLEKQAEGKGFLSQNTSYNLMHTIDNFLFKMPSEVREKISKDYKDLINNPITAESLINFYKDINHNLGNTTKQLSLLKDPIKEAIKEISPEIGEKFETINKLFTKFYPIAAKLKPSLNSDIMGASKALASLYSVITGDYIKLGGLVGYHAMGKLSQKLLLNPRYQQISHKMAQSIAQNKFGMTRKLIDLLSKQLEKDSPEIAEQIESVTDEELLEMFSNHHKKAD